MTRLVFLRHGQSVWNHERRFTGWADVALSPQGHTQAETAGKLLKEAGYAFDICFTSVLQRAQKTLEIVLEILDQNQLPIHTSWRLNERHYGALQGFSTALHRVLTRLDRLAEAGASGLGRFELRDHVLRPR